VPVRRLSFFYFAYFAILGVLVPYWPLYLSRVGYDAVDIGLIMALVPLTKILSPGFWGWWADRTHQPLRLVRWVSWLSFVGFLPVFLDRHNLWLIGGVMMLFSFSWNGSLPLFETLTLNHLQAGGRYGRIRLWGSMGFLLSVFVVGEWLDGLLPLERLPELLAILLLIQWLASLMVPDAKERLPKEPAPRWVAMLARPEVIQFLLSGLLLQVAHGPFYAFYSVFLGLEGYKDAVIGQLWALGVFAEIVVFLWFHRLQRHVSLRALYLSSLVLSAIRWLMLGAGLTHPIGLMVAQILHAGTFGSAHAASIALIHRYFKGAHHAKGQALYSAFSYGLGGALGSVISGECWTRFGPETMFLGASLVSAVALVVAWPRVGRHDPDGAHRTP
ncbi:MAG: MFS transporter, partial [Methylococcaceae bacterium]